MIRADLQHLGVSELLEIAQQDDNEDDARAAAVALHERFGFGLWVDDPSEPSDAAADRAADAWQRGRDRVAERAR